MVEKMNAASSLVEVVERIIDTGNVIDNFLAFKQSRNMQKIMGIFLVFLCITIIFAAGCTSTRLTAAAPLVASTPTYTSQPSSVSPTYFSGSASDTQGFTVTGGGGFMFTASYSGQRNFMAGIKDNNGESVEFGVFNEIGSYTGKKVIHLDPGKYYLEVFMASGPWTIDISPT